MKAIVYNDDLGTEQEIVEIPDGARRQAAGPRASLLEAVSPTTTTSCIELILERGRDPGGAAQAGDPQGHPRHQADPGAVRLLLQEQGRAAAARRGRRLPALAARRAAGDRRRPGRRARTRREGIRPADDTEPFAALAFKIMADPFVGKLTYFRVYSGQARGRLARAQRRQRAGPSGSAAS